MESHSEMLMVSYISLTDMKYILADRTEAQSIGIKLYGHRFYNDSVVLNERELNNNIHLSSLPTLEEKAKRLKGKVFSLAEIMLALNTK